MSFFGAIAAHLSKPLFTLEKDMSLPPAQSERDQERAAAAAPKVVVTPPPAHPPMPAPTTPGLVSRVEAGLESAVKDVEALFDGTPATTAPAPVATVTPPASGAAASAPSSVDALVAQVKQGLATHATLKAQHDALVAQMKANAAATAAAQAQLTTAATSLTANATAVQAAVTEANAG